jgi:hypothetical protein
MSILWILAKDAVAFNKVKEILDENDLKYYIIDKEIDSRWEKIKKEILDEIEMTDNVYSLGIRGVKPDKVREVSKFIINQSEIKKYENVIKNVLNIVGKRTIKPKTKKNYQDKEVEERVNQKSLIEKVNKKEEIKEIEKYININTIDELVGGVLISKQIKEINTNSTSQEITREYYKKGNIWVQNGVRILDGNKENNKINWEEPKFLKEYELSFDEKIIVLVNKGDFDNVLDFKIKKGPIKFIPDVIEKIRIARKDLALFNIELDSECSKRDNLQDIYLNYNQNLDLVDQEIDKLRAKIKNTNHKKEDEGLLKKQEEYSSVLKEQLKHEDIFKIQNELVYQLDEIGSLVNNYEHQVEKYKIWYYEKKIMENK